MTPTRGSPASAPGVTRGRRSDGGAVRTVSGLDDELAVHRGAGLAAAAGVAVDVVGARRRRGVDAHDPPALAGRSRRGQLLVDAELVADERVDAALEVGARSVVYLIICKDIAP